MGCYSFSIVLVDTVGPEAVLLRRRSMSSHGWRAARLIHSLAPIWKQSQPEPLLPLAMGDIHVCYHLPSRVADLCTVETGNDAFYEKPGELYHLEFF